jgi:hypothetical protein
MSTTPGPLQHEEPTPMLSHKSFSSKLQGQAYLPCLNAQCPFPVDYNEGALGVHSPAPIGPRARPPTFLKASHTVVDKATDRVSASAPNSKADIEGPQYAQYTSRGLP